MKGRKNRRRSAPNMMSIVARAVHLRCLLSSPLLSSPLLSKSYLRIPWTTGATLDRNPYVPPATSISPLAGVTHAVYCRALMIRPKLPVAVAAANRGATYPLVYVNSSAPPVTGSPVEDTYPNSVASTGVLHGDAANAQPAELMPTVHAG